MKSHPMPAAMIFAVLVAAPASADDPAPAQGRAVEPGAIADTGDWPLHPNTAYAIEGNVAMPLDGWDGQHVQIKLEQSAYFDGERVIYLAGRQTDWHVVR